jgi:hypothetical protein
MSENLEKTEKNLRDLIETLRDGHQGFSYSGKKRWYGRSSQQNSRMSCITSGSRT